MKKGNSTKSTKVKCNGRIYYLSKISSGKVNIMYDSGENGLYTLLVINTDGILQRPYIPPSIGYLRTINGEMMEVENE